MKQILIATDGSPSAHDAIDVGLELAKEQGADVTFVHVADPDQWTGGRGGTVAIAHTEEVDDSELVLKTAGQARGRGRCLLHPRARLRRDRRVHRGACGRDRRRPDRGRVARAQPHRHRAARQRLARRAPPSPPAGPRGQDREDACRDGRLSSRYAAGGGDSAGPASSLGSAGPMSSRNGGYSSRMRPT